MIPKKQMSILEFSNLTGIKRENLRFYDRIGLLSPEGRGENNYRYYSHHQLGTAYLISTLRWIGVSIEEIKKYSGKRTPEMSLELLAEQDARIEAEIERLRETRQIMKSHSDMIREALAQDANAILLLEKEREPIFLCPPTPPDMDEDEGEVFAYDYADAQGVNLGYPFGTRLAQHYLSGGGDDVRLQYYFKAAEHSNAEKPAGLYAVAYGRCSPWDSHGLYLRLLDFIRQEGLRICGDAYEECPLGDISVQSLEHFCIRVEIPVTK